MLNSTKRKLLSSHIPTIPTLPSAIERVFPAHTHTHTELAAVPYGSGFFLSSMTLCCRTSSSSSCSPIPPFRMSDRLSDSTVHSSPPDRSSREFRVGHWRLTVVGHCDHELRLAIANSRHECGVFAYSSPPSSSSSSSSSTVEVPNPPPFVAFVLVFSLFEGKSFGLCPWQHVVL